MFKVDLNADYAAIGFEDGDPQWLEGFPPRPCKTSRAAEQQRLSIVAFVEKYAQTDIRASSLARRLGACCVGFRCGSGACSVCMRALQRLFVQPSSKLLSRETDLVACSIIPAQGTCLANALSESHLLSTASLISAALKSAEMPLAIGGIDVSFNEHVEALFEPHWSVHAWLISPTITASQHRHLCDCFPPSATITIPVRVARFDGNLAAIAYALKAEYQRRLTIPGGRFDGDPRRQNTRDRKLRVAEKMQLLLTLDELCPDKRLILHKSKWAVADTHPRSLILIKSSKRRRERNRV